MNDPSAALDQLRRQYQAQYRYCCQVKSEAAYTRLTCIRHKAQYLCGETHIPFPENDFKDPVPGQIQRLIFRCQTLHTALVAELRKDAMHK